MENIKKIIDKPIVLQHRKASESDKANSSSAFEEKEEQDFIEESKGLSSKNHQSQYSIKESIKEEKEDEDDIIEEIPEGGDSESHQSEDEIKESVYADGKKVADKAPETGLSKVRMAMGSEEKVRKESK